MKTDKRILRDCSEDDHVEQDVHTDIGTTCCTDTQILRKRINTSKPCKKILGYLPVNTAFFPAYNPIRKMCDGPSGP